MRAKRRVSPAVAVQDDRSTSTSKRPKRSTVTSTSTSTSTSTIDRSYCDSCRISGSTRR